MTTKFGARIEENRVAIEMLRARDATREEQFSALEQTSRELETRLQEAEGGLEHVAELESELERVRTRLESLEQAGIDDGRRIADLGDRLRELEEGRAEELRRLDRIERALKIEE